jgi:hypothetical protein
VGEGPGERVHKRIMKVFLRFPLSLTLSHKWERGLLNFVANQ